MENQQNKKGQGPIDEAYLMSVMAGDAKSSVPSQKLKQDDEQAVIGPKDKIRQKKTVELTYGERFLDNHTMNRRGEKSIYIRQQYHERLSRIIQVIGEDKIPMYAYLDNILRHHFELFEKAITEDFNSKFKPIF